MKKIMTRSWLVLTAALLTTMGIGCGNQEAGAGSGEVTEIVNVSYDPTRELYKEVNEAFSQSYEKKTGQKVKVAQSHGGSGAQARAVIDGLKADVVTLALAGDIEAVSRKGLINDGWQKSLPHNSSPYTSTIVLVVRKGNPKSINDWADLIRPGVEVVTPNPKTSGGARWNFLAAWGYVTLTQKKGEAEAVDFVQKLFANVKKLDTGARGSSETFARRKQGDVFISWENEALLLQKEFPADGFEIKYPSVSILAEPPVAIVDKNVDARGTRAVAKAYLEFLYTDEAQDIVGKHGYRPTVKKFQEKYAATLPPIRLFTLAEVAGTWAQAQSRFFGDGGVFDQIYAKR